MYFIYFLRSQSNLDKTYIGYTNNIARRLEEHNAGQSVYTSRFVPWALEALALADTQDIAVTVEAYFKNNSGQEKFKKFSEVYPGHPNPINGYFSSLTEGKKFGRSSFRVLKNEGTVVFTACI